VTPSAALQQQLSQLDLAIHDIGVRAVREDLSPQAPSVLVEALETRAGGQTDLMRSPVGRMACSVREACKRAIKRGELRSIRIGGRTVIRPKN
jgi:hypothetical protein